MTKTTKRKPGRPKGSLDKRTVAMRRARQAGQTPVEFLLGIMNDTKNELPVRMQAASSAAPYCHARLASVTVQEKPFDGDPNSITSEYLASIIKGTSGSDVAVKAKGKRTTH